MFFTLALFLANFLNYQDSTGAYKLNEVYQKACHNCYDTSYSKSIHQVLSSVNAIEIDFYDSKNILNHRGAVPGHWYVRHKGWGDNINCCFSAEAGKNDLDSCLKDVSVWCANHPNHDLITIFLDKKQGWSKGRLPEDLDKLILKYFDLRTIYTPSNLKDTFPSFRASALKGNWPKMSELKGKVIFGLTGGNLFHPNKTLSQYARSRKNNAVIFVAPSTKKSSQIVGHPNGFKTSDKPYIVFYNFKSKKEELTYHTQKLNLISRVFGIQEDKENYTKAARYANYIAVFNYDSDLFTTGKIN